MTDVTLRTGAEVPRRLVLDVNIALEKLAAPDTLALSEIVHAARVYGYVPYGYTRGVLNDLLLLRHDGTMWDPVRAVILASTDGDDPAIRLVAPCPAEVTR